jgi:hypothetical protein
MSRPMELHTIATVPPILASGLGGSKK